MGFGQMPIAPEVVLPVPPVSAPLKLHLTGFQGRNPETLTELADFSIWRRLSPRLGFRLRIIRRQENASGLGTMLRHGHRHP